MTIQEQIKHLIQEEFKPEYLLIEDESARHAGHAGSPGGGETHFQVWVASNTFQGLPRVKRHRMLHQTLKHLLKENIHALGLHVFTPAEWQKKQQMGK